MPWNLYNGSIYWAFIFVYNILQFMYQKYAATIANINRLE